MGIMMLPTMLIMFMFFALGLDAGLWYFDHRWAQTQAEAAAAAGIVFLPSTDASDAIAASDLWLQRNGTDPAIDSTCPRSGVGTGRLVSDFDGDGRYDTVRVCVRRLRPTLFATLSGVTSVYISAKATARVEEVPSHYALMAMDDHACDALYLNGNPIVNVTGGGGTYTRSDCSGANQGALHVQGTNAQLNTGLNDVVGGAYRNPANPPINPPATPQDYLDDPFADLLQPVPSSTCSLTNGLSNINSNTTLSPGTYCYNVQITGNGTTVRLQPGIYIFEHGLDVGAQSILTGDVNSNNTLDPAEEVLLYSTCPLPAPCSGRPAGDITFQGGSTVRLRGIGGLFTREMVLWVDRTSGGSPEISVGGNSAASGIEGRIYNLNGTVEISGTGGANLTLNMAVVAETIHFQGDATFNMPYNPILAPTERRLGIIE